jgi:hypothetical protein
MSAKRKHIYLSLRRLPKNKMSARKKMYFTISFIHVRVYLPLPISVTLSIFTGSAFIFPTLTPDIPVFFTAILQHIIVSLMHCLGYSALKTLHYDFW